MRKLTAPLGSEPDLKNRSWARASPNVPPPMMITSNGLAAIAACASTNVLQTYRPRMSRLKSVSGVSTAIVSQLLIRLLAKAPSGPTSVRDRLMSIPP